MNAMAVAQIQEEAFVAISSLFNVEATIQGDKITFERSSIFSPESLPFLGRSGSNNGIVGYVECPLEKINRGKIITIALDGSTGATFYQHHPFCSGQNIWILRPKPEMIQDFDQFIALYLVASIRKAVRNYTYNLSLTKSRLLKVEVLVPTVDGRFDADLARQRIKALRNSSLIESIPSHRIFE